MQIAVQARAASFLMPPCTSGRWGGTPAAAPAPARTHPRRRGTLCVVAGGSKKLSEADMYAAAEAPGVGAPLPPPQRSLPPWYVLAPVALAATVVVLRTLKALRRRFSGQDRLSERGLKRAGSIADDRYYTKMMKGMRTVQYEELSDEQIAAARRRRQREVGRDRAPMDLDQIDLPDNHPFAVKKEVTPEEEERMRARLAPRRQRLSAEDLELLRKAQAEADAEEEAASKA